ncbi:choloylglycine hydrolase, partial [Francisella tularensis subsp. holarctica]|nr:choloylglycine hydrolase [Francisella tularensis subsp. holarctica]
IALSQNRLYVVDTLVGNIVYVNLNKANLDKGQAVRTISLINDILTEDITNDMTPIKETK